MTDITTNLIKDKIIKVLEIYPKISPSMLQIAIGSSLSPVIWRPVLEELVLLGIVKQDDIIELSASGRHQTYKVIQLIQSSEQVANNG